MMTKLNDIKNFFRNLVNQLKKKDYLVEDCRRPENNYPLYWLAPSVDRGLQRVRLRSVYRGGLKHDDISNIYHYPKYSKFLTFALSFIGLAPRPGREPLVRVIRIEGRNIVEQGQRGVRLAALLNQDYVIARVVDFDYASLKKRMRVFMHQDGAIVGVAGTKKGVYNYHGLCPENVEVLIERHNVLCQDLAAAGEQKSAAGMGRSSANISQARGKARTNLVLLKG